MEACSLLRPQPHYRSEAFAGGLKACGYKVTTEPKAQPSPADLLLLWNRYGHAHDLALRYERAGAAVLVAENGSLGRDRAGGPWYSLARSWPNAPGYVGDDSRKLPDAGWKADGETILVLPQRGFTAPPAGQPTDWVKRLQLKTKRQIVIREHPGNDPQHDSLMRDLERAWCTVTWASGAAIKGLFAGVPCFYGRPDFVGSDASLRIGADIESPYRGDRSAFLRRLSWSMWTPAEIATGLPFRRLLCAAS